VISVLSDEEFSFWTEAAFCFAHQGLSAQAATSEADRFLLEALKRHPEGIPSKDQVPRYVELLREVLEQAHAGATGAAPPAPPPKRPYTSPVIRPLTKEEADRVKGGFETK
jgi:hypothetical protein